MAVEKWNDAQFEANIGEDKLTVVDFGATWCGPCKKLHPIMTEIAQEYGEKIRVIEIDIGEAKNTAQKFSIFSVPQLGFFRKGERVANITGLQSKAKIVDQIEKLL